MTTLYEFGKVDDYNGTDVSEFMVIGSACPEILDVRVDGNSVVMDGVANINLTNYPTKLDVTTTLGDYATKDYVDDNVSGIVLASAVAVTPVGGVASTNAQSAIAELDIEKVSWSGDTIGVKKNIGSIDNYGIGFITNNTERITITSDGKVGIGTTTPTYAMEIKTPSGMINYFQVTGNDVSPFAGFFRVGNYTSNPGVMAPVFTGRSNQSGFSGLMFLGDTASDTGTVAVTQFVSRANNSIVSTRPLFSFANYTNSDTKMIILANGNVGINTTSPTAKLDVNSDIIRLRTPKTPATSGDTGNAGDICWDANYVYICISTNTWKRSPLSTW